MWTGQRVILIVKKTKLKNLNASTVDGKNLPHVQVVASGGTTVGGVNIRGISYGLGDDCRCHHQIARTLNECAEVAGIVSPKRQGNPVGVAAENSVIASK